VAMTAPTKPKYPKKVQTKIVGVNFEGRQALLEKAAQHNIKVLELIPEPTNEYDADAIQVVAPVFDSDGKRTGGVQLGYISNSDRMCIVCGKMTDGASFSRSKTAKCPHCAYVFPFAKGGQIECPKCKKFLDTDLSKTVTCPTCMGDEWVRDGLATLLCRAMEAGVKYTCIVSEYTGGDVSEKTGKTKCRGCNIKVEAVESTFPV
jgi:hypothetical protein